MNKSVWVVLAMIGLAVAYYLGQGTETSVARKTAVELITAISDGWRVEELKKRSDPGLIAAMSSQGQSAEELMKIYSVLGALKQAPTCNVKTSGEFMKENERHLTMSMECDAEYEKGRAVISLTLSRAQSSEQWVLYYINIRSEALGGGEVIE